MHEKTKIYLAENFKWLCKVNNISHQYVLNELKLTKNYRNVLGALRIANYFEVSLDRLLTERLNNNNKTIIERLK